MIFTSLEFPIDITTGQCLKFSAEMEQVSIVKSRILQGIPTSDASSLVTGTKNFGQQVTQPVQAGSKVKEKIESQSFLSGITGLGS